MAGRLLRRARMTPGHSAMSDHRFRDDEDSPRLARASLSAVVLWISITVVLLIVCLGVAVVLARNPGLTETVWPQEAPAPRVVVN